VIIAVPLQYSRSNSYSAVCKFQYLLGFGDLQTTTYRSSYSIPMVSIHDQDKELTQDIRCHSVIAVRAAPTHLLCPLLSD
jgi:hypothetical protein